MTKEERWAEIQRQRLLNQRLANAKFSDYQTPMGGPRRRGRGGLLNSTLGALSSVVSNDENDLDNVSFSTDNGMKVNFQNNRNKDSTPTHKVLEDFSWYKGNYGTDNMIEEGIPVHDLVAQQPDVHPREEAFNKHREGLKLEQSDAIGAFIKKNSAQPLYQIPDRSYGTDVNNILSDYANFEGIGEIPQQYTQSDFEPHYLPLGDGEEWYVESPEEEEFLLNSTIAERAAYTNMNPEETTAFLKNRVSGEGEFELPVATGMDALYPELDPELSTQMPLLEPEDRDVFVTDDAEMIKTDLTAYEEAILDGDMDLARDIRKQGHADNYQRYEELKVLYPNQGLTSQYFPDVDYSHPNLIAQLKQKNDENLGDVFDLHNPFNWTIGYADNKENKHKYSVGGDTGLLEYSGVDLREEEIENVNLNNYKKLLNDSEDSLILEDMAKRDAEILKLAADKREFAALGGGYVSEPEDEPLYQIPDRTYTDIAEDGIIDSDITSDYADYANVLSEDPEVAEVQLAEEEVETQTAATELENSSNESNEAKTAADEVIDGDDDDEVKESKLSDIFGWLTDLFGVDNKSLLRAFVKYVGGRLFGLSSGKAAAFAWKGIEQDMAISAAKGAEARKWQDNMDEYDKMYDDAIAAGDIDGAERIFRQRAEHAGIDKTDAEEYFDNVEFLEGKLAQAIADQKPEMVKAITAQLERYKLGGIDGTTTVEPVYDVTVQDANGNEKILDARDGPSGREIQLPNGKFVPVKDYKSDDPNFGEIIHISKVNPSDAQPIPFRIAGGRYDSETDSEFEEQLDAIDAKFESGGYGEGDEAEIAAYYDRVQVHNANKNRNSYGQLYVKKIPYARNISNTGVVSFPPFKEAEKKSAYQLAEGVRGLAKLKIISENPKAMAQVNKWTAQWESIATGNDMEYGAISSYISKNYKANPLQQAYYMGMLELTTSKLRRDTGAAYNMKEMYDTMTRYTNYKDASTEVTEMKLAGAEVDLEAIAGMTRSGQYWLGILDGTYRPSDSWQNMMGSIYTMMENEGVYSSVGDGGDGGSTRKFEEDYPG